MGAGRTTRAVRARGAHEFASVQGGVVHRAQLRSRGISRADVRSEFEAGRWTGLGRHTVLIGPPPLSAEAARWQAVWESGAGAALDGVAALLAAGLTGFRTDRLDISLPHANRDHPVPGVTLHRRREMPPTVTAGIPRVRPAQAALSAAQWCTTDRQAALVLCLVIQQRLVRPADLQRAFATLTRCRRRTLIAAVVRDLCDGAHSLGELDFARLCRRRGLPEPTRQVVRTLPDGRVYLDAEWEEIGLVVEIDGGHHAAALNPVADALRQNEVVLGGASVLRIPVIGLRLDASRFMDQVARAHHALTARAAWPTRGCQQRGIPRVWHPLVRLGAEHDKGGPDRGRTRLRGMRQIT